MLSRFKLYLIPGLIALLFGSQRFLSASEKEPLSKQPKNILLVCVDDLRPELGCYGVKYIRSPNIDKLAKQGRLFSRHYVQAPTCGASRYTLLTGQYGSPDNGALFRRAGRLQKSADAVPPSLPAWFRNHGYTTVSVGKVSHHPGGRGGRDWNAPDSLEMPNSWDQHLLPAGPWQHPRGWMHGLAHGEIRKNAKEMDVFQAIDDSDMAYPDGISIAEATRQIKQLANQDKPFFLAVGILRPHLPFGAPKKYLDAYLNVQLPDIPNPTKPDRKTTWHGSGEFMKYNRWKKNPNTDIEFSTQVRKHYAACVSYADAQVGKLLNELEKRGKKNDTVVVLWGDHGWHLGEHAVWGKHTLFEESLRSPLIISYPGIPQAGKSTAAVVETLDLFPTLCDLASIERPKYAHGQSLLDLCENPLAAGHPAISYKGKVQTVRTTSHRLVLHPDGFVELYNHLSPEKESKNVAEQYPEMVKKMKQILSSRLPTPNLASPESN